MEIRTERDYLRAKLELAKLRAKEELYRSQNRVRFWNPLEHQRRVIEYVHEGKKTILMQGANQIGKTVCGVNLACAFSLGYQPWDGRETIFPKGRPVEGRILCTDWEKAAKETIVPKLKEWLPAGSYETKKNNVGVESEFFFRKTKSRFTLLTYKEDTKSHEGWTGDWVWCDEPPPRDKYVANRRGLVARNGIMLITMTALDQPWILDDIALNHDPTIGIVADVPIRANTHLTEDAIQVFEKSCTEDERVARIAGGWLQLQGRIWKSFNRDVHVVDGFKVPLDWPVSFQIDFHLNKPHAISFMAVDKYGRHFVIDEIWENMPSESIADEIIRRKVLNGWRITRGEIDALSKGDTSYIRNRIGQAEDSFTIITRLLRKHGIRLEVGSKDEKSYVRAVDGWFNGVNGPPLLYIFRSCTETIRQIDRWTYDDKGKPKDDGHFPECIGRFSQMGLKYTDPVMFEKELERAAVPA